MRRLNIIVLEDDYDDRWIIAEAFKDSDINIINFASTYEQLMQSLTDFSNPDLIISDMQLSLRNGLEIAELLKRSTSFTDIPFVLLSNGNSELFNSSHNTELIDGYFEKPSSFNGYHDIATTLHQMVADRYKVVG